MKFYDEPSNEHLKLAEHKYHNIHKINGKGYIIIHTKDKVRYYYGCYKTLDEAININHLLKTRKYPISLSRQIIGLRGETYKKVLKERLEK